MHWWFLYLVVAGLLVACNDPVLVEPVDTCKPLADSLTLLEDLAGFGQKMVGTPAGHTAGDYLKARMDELGLQDVRFESFQVPVWTKTDSTVTFISGSETFMPDHDVFAFTACANAPVEAEIVYMGEGQASDYNGVDVRGKAVMVDRSVLLHRSSQYRYIEQAGGAAMVYLSKTEGNHIQIGTAGEPFDGCGQIPAVTVGVDDGATLKKLADSADGLQIKANVQVDFQQGTGRNVIGSITGTTYPDHEIIVGAHYDTWHEGAADNGTGTVATLRIAEQLSCLRNFDPAYTITFILYDGEEIGLYGSYDYVIKHYDRHQNFVANFNMEMPASEPNELTFLALSNNYAVEQALADAGAMSHYGITVTIPVIQQFTGGIIPTDIQAFYFRGLNVMTTFSNTWRYHTDQDTPDRIDIPFLDEATTIFSDAIINLQAYAPEEFQSEREVLYTDLEIEATELIGTCLLPEGCDNPPAFLNGTLHVSDTSGNPIDYTDATVRVFRDGFLPVTTVTPVREATGVYRIAVDPEDTALAGAYTVDALVQVVTEDGTTVNGEDFAVVGETRQ